jgi:hypothetical protein
MLNSLFIPAVLTFDTSRWINPRARNFIPIGPALALGTRRIELALAGISSGMI